MFKILKRLIFLQLVDGDQDSIGLMEDMEDNSDCDSSFRKDMPCYASEYTVKKAFRYSRPQPAPAGMSLAKLSLGGNNLYMTSLFPPRESLVSDIPAGDGNIKKLFLRCSESLFQLVKSNPFTYPIGGYKSKNCRGHTIQKYSTLNRKFETYLPRNETARPLSQFLHSCTYERFIYSQDPGFYVWFPTSLSVIFFKCFSSPK
jgi:hypothetical protein